MLGLVASGGNPRNLASVNPMTFLLETPSNYIGELYQPDTTTLPRRSWYFDQQSQELVYLINDADEVFLLRNGAQQPTRELRFRIEVEYRSTTDGVETVSSSPASVGSGNERARLAGMVLRPVIPYVWGTSPTFMEYAEESSVSG